MPERFTSPIVSSTSCFGIGQDKLGTFVEVKNPAGAEGARSTVYHRDLLESILFQVAV
jgi:hypothetical protein